MSESTIPSPEMWNNVLKGNVEKDDPFWKEYLDKAAVFDVRMVDEWNKTVDVLLVYVGLLISVLTSFITSTTSTQLKRNPADITNDLLVAIYNQTVAQSNNIFITPVNLTSYFNLSPQDYDAAVTQTALLYVSLSLSIVVSFIALAAKLWLVNYSRQAFSVGSPYDRAMKRQEAYNGVLVWNMGGVINMLPVILLIALYMFGYCVYTMVSAVQMNIGYAIQILLGLGLIFLVFTSFNAAACISGCPFRSPFSDVIRSYWEKVYLLVLREFFIQKRCPSIWMWIECIILLIAGLATSISFLKVPIIVLPVSAIMFSFPILLLRALEKKVVHKPQRYKISRLAACICLFVVMLIQVPAGIGNFPYGIASFVVVVSLIFIVAPCIAFTLWMFGKMSKSMADTGEIDAIAWILITTPPQYPVTFFKKVGQMTGDNSIGRHYRPRLLETLMPLLTPLITSYHPPEHHSSDTHSPQSNDALNRRPQTNLSPVNDNMVTIDEDPHVKDLEIYIACLAQLSDFEDYKGTWKCLWEDKMQHPKLEQLLIANLVILAKPQLNFPVRLRNAATKVLKNYKLNREGKPLERHTTTVLENVATDPRGETIPMLNDPMSNFQEEGHSELYRLEELATHVEPAHSSEEVEEVRREIGDEEIEEVRREIEDEEIEEVRRDVGDEEIEENPLESSTTILENAATDPRGETTLMLKTIGRIVKDRDSELYSLVDPATHVKPAYSPEEETEEVRRETGDR